MSNKDLPSGIPNNATLSYDGKIFKVYTWKQELFDGSQSKFERVVVRGSVLIIPVTDRNTVLMAKQTQPARETFVGFIGGKMEKNESPLECAKRELLEETNISGVSWSSLGMWSPFYKVHWPQHYFAVEQLTTLPNNSLDKNEKIDLIECDVDEFHNLMLNDNFSDYIFKSIYLSTIIKYGKPRTFEELLRLLKH